MLNDLLDMLNGYVDKTTNEQERDLCPFCGTLWTSFHLWQWKQTENEK